MAQTNRRTEKQTNVWSHGIALNKKQKKNTPCFKNAFRLRKFWCDVWRMEMTEGRLVASIQIQGPAHSKLREETKRACDYKMFS